MKDRVSTKILDNGATRYGVYDETGKLLRYEYIKLEDEPDEEGTILNKANLLTDEVARQVGLRTADPTPNDMFNVLAHVGNLHVWERVQTVSDPIPEVPAGYTLGKVETNVILYTGSKSGTRLIYASTVNVSNAGVVTMVSGTTVAYSGTTNPSIYNDKLPGMFVIADTENNHPDHSTAKAQVIFYVPPDATFSWNSDYNVVVSKYQSVTGYPYTPAIPAGTTTDYLTSTDRNAYPDQSAEGGQDAYYELGDVVSNYDLGQSGSNIVVTYSSDIVVSDDGVVTMVEPNSVLMNNIGTDAASTFFGKFLKTSINDSVVFIPVDATASYDNSSGFSHVILSKYQPVTGHAAIPSSTTITYLGQLGEGARIEVGSYVGTGTYGSLNPITLTFVGIPKLVIVEREQASGNSYSNGLGVFFYGQKIAQVHWHLRGSGSSNANVVLSWNQNAVSWYGNDSSAHLNDENVTYHYIAIG